jgi:pre-mRNA-processing factor 40
LSSLHAQPAFQNDPLLARLDSIEIVILYESRMKIVEQAYEEQRAKERLQQRRAARHAREAFKMLLETHLDAGRITWRSKWQGCLPLWKSDDIYLALLGKSGSSPLDLFHDLVDDLTGAIEGKAKSVEGLLEEVGFAVKLETERSQFDDALASIKFQGSETDKNDLWEVVRPLVPLRLLPSSC